MTKLQKYPGLRTPDSIVLEWAALQHKLGFTVTKEEIDAFGDLITPGLWEFILLKQQYLEN